MSIKPVGTKWVVDSQPGGRGRKRFRKTFQTKTEAIQFERWLQTEHAVPKPWDLEAEDRSALREARTASALSILSPCAPRSALQSIPGGGRGSYIYVMLCPGHARDVWKVGFTTVDPHKRAEELSKVTAAPIRFVVIQFWAVRDAKRAEKIVFEAIAKYRFNKQREFFLTPYWRLRDEIERALVNFIV